MMEHTMTTEERDQLIQRYFDGETIGDEAALAERLLEVDPEAQDLLATLRTLSDSIKIDVAGALAEEDFSQYWTNIADRLPQGPLSLAEQGDELVVAPTEPLVVGPSFFDRIFGWSGLAAAGAAAAIIAVGLLTGGGEVQPPGPPAVAAIDQTIVIEDIDSPSSMVSVQQENHDEPAIIWIVESDEV